MTIFPRFAGRPVPTWGWALAYASVFLALRIFLSPNLGADDVEAALFAQGWSLGYNPKQPPFYTWILMGLYGIFGPSLWAHLLLRYGLIFLSILGLARCVRRSVPHARMEILAPLVLPLLFPIGWGAQLGFTHTLLLMACVFWLLAAFLDFAEKPTIPRAAELGFAIFSGLMSKYNFLLFPVPLAMAALTLPNYRKALFHPHAITAALLAAASCIPSLLWLYGTVSGMDGPPPTSPAMIARAKAMAGFAGSAIAFLSPLILLLPLLGKRLFTAPLADVREHPEQHLLLRTILVSMGILACALAVGLIPGIKSRYLHPVLLPVLPLLLLRLEEIGPGQAALRRFQGVGIALVAFMGFALALQGSFEPKWCRNCRWHTDMPTLAKKIAQSGFSGGGIIAVDEHIAGNMRIHFPKSAIWTPAYARDLAIPRQTPCLGIRRGTSGLHTASIPMLRSRDRTTAFSWIMAPQCDEALLRWVMEPQPAQAPAAAGN